MPGEGERGVEREKGKERRGGKDKRKKGERRGIFFFLEGAMLD